MRYMLLIHSDERVYPKMSEKETADLMAAYGRFSEEVEKAGVRLDSARLRPTSERAVQRHERSQLRLACLNLCELGTE